MSVTAPHTQPHRIIDIVLDGSTLASPSADIEIERHKAVSDLIDTNTFKLNDTAMPGPYRMHMGIDDGRLAIRIACAASGLGEDIRLSLSSLRKLLADYAILCENFYKTARAGQIHRLEAIDAGRRSIHDEGAETLIEALENKAITDKLTARRLFSLLYVLHMRHNPTIT